MSDPTFLFSVTMVLERLRNSDAVTAEDRNEISGLVEKLLEERELLLQENANLKRMREEILNLIEKWEHIEGYYYGILYEED